MIDPKNLKKWFFLIAVLYLIFPRDLIPDYFGRGLGLIDDVAVMGFLSYYFRNYVRRYMAAQGVGRAGQSSDGQAQAKGPRQNDSAHATPDPHEVLGITRGASQEEIRDAYRARMREYHPDKVAHLGEELQQLAHRRSLDIQEAYRRLKR